MAKVAYKRRQEKGEREQIRIKLKKDDQVKVIAGRDKGKTGKILDVNRYTGRVTVEGVMLMKRHTKPNPAKQIKGGIAEREASIHASNVMILTADGVATRIGYKAETTGGKTRRIRVARKSGEPLDEGKKK